MNRFDKSQVKADCCDNRLIIYQLLPRLFTNVNESCQPFGSLEQNGSGKMNDYSLEVLESIKQLGVNCIWYTGIIENATKTDFSACGIPADNPNVVKGEAGSPYAIKDYYDVNPCLAENVEKRVEEFRELVGRTHRAGMKMIIDFVPNHTARVYHSDAKPEGVKDFGSTDDTTMMFAPSNNYYYITSQQFAPHFDINGFGRPYREFPAKATGNDCFTAFPGIYDWYETVKLNYGHDYGNNSDHFVPIPDTWLKMLDILLYWASMGIDGFRCDMVFMVPLNFWHWVIGEVKKRYPHILFIGEIYDIALYRPFLDYGSFDYLYDKVNLYDTLVGIERHRVSAAKLTGCWQAVDGIGERMLNFLENHDEVRFASEEYAGNPAYVVPSLTVGAMMTKGPFMIYFAQEIGEAATDNEGFAGNNHRTSIFDYWSYETMRRWYNGGHPDGSKLTPAELWLRNLYSRVLHLCNSEKALRCGDFFDLMYVNLSNPDFDPNDIYAFFRYIPGEEAILVVANFGHEPHDCRIYIPRLFFDMASMDQGIVDATDLLTDKKLKLALKEDVPLLVSVGQKNAVALKFKIQGAGNETENADVKVDCCVGSKSEKR